MQSAISALVASTVSQPPSRNFSATVMVRMTMQSAPPTRWIQTWFFQSGSLWRVSRFTQ